MKKIGRTKSKKILADRLVLFCASLFLLLFATAELKYHTSGGISHTATVYRAFLLCVICLQFYLGACLARQRDPSSKAMSRVMILFFFLYLYLILNFTLADASLGRGRDSVYGTAENTRQYYMEHFVNLIPFRSIYNVYIRGFINGYVNAFYVFLNLLGNICAFMPFAFFLPHFFKKQARWYWFLPSMILTVCAVELLQLAFMVGSCDVDDLILNVGGAFFLFVILKISFFKKLIFKLTGKTEAL